MIKLKTFKDIKLLAEALGNELAILSQLGESRCIAIPGGETPKEIFKIISNSENIDWNNIKIFWSDERCVPPGHTDSNYYLAEQYLFKYINIPPGNIFRIRGEENPEEEAKRYSDLVSKQLGDAPVFDMIILGIGSDGHTASIFSDQMEILSSDKIYTVSHHPETHQSRITMTGKVLKNSKNNYFCVTGESKANIIHKIFDENLYCPTSVVGEMNNNSILYIDEKASKLLKNFN